MDLRRIDIPRQLREIPQPPKQLYIEGELPQGIYLAVVGSRKYSAYGQEVCERLISELTNHPIVIVSGLALGIDAIAHRAALKAGLKTIGVPGSGLDRRVLYPRTNVGLAEDILQAGGALLSEFEPTLQAAPWTFPARNRIMAGLCKAVLVIEASEKSGTLITARLATEYNRDVLTVPGSIFSEQSAGPHMLIRLGATPVTSGRDILEALGIATDPGPIQERLFPMSPEEEKILTILKQGTLSKEELIRVSGLIPHEVISLLAVMEIKGLVRESLGKMHSN